MITRLKEKNIYYLTHCKIPFLKMLLSCRTKLRIITAEICDFLDKKHVQENEKKKMTSKRFIQPLTMFRVKKKQYKESYLPQNLQFIYRNLLKFPYTFYKDSTCKYKVQDKLIVQLGMI